MKHSYLIVIVLVILGINCNAIKHEDKGARTTLCVDFLGGFYEDTVSFICNKEQIFSDVVATSEAEYGFSRVRVEFFEDLNGKHYVETLIHSKLETKSIAPLPKDSIIFIFKLNTFSRGIVRDTLKVALSDGKFIGVSKTDFKLDTAINSIKLTPVKIEIAQSRNRLIFH